MRKFLSWLLVMVMCLSGMLVNITLPETEAKAATEGGSLLVYTKNEDTWYNSGNAARVINSMHLAYSEDGETYQALNYNYGVLFAKTDYTENASLVGVIKTMVTPYVFRMKDNSFGVLAVRANENGGDDSAHKGEVLFYTSEDMITYEEHGFIKLNSDGKVVVAPQCQYDAASDAYIIAWKDKDGNVYNNETTDFETFSGPEEGELLEEIVTDYKVLDTSKDELPEVNATLSNTIDVSAEELTALLNRFTKVTNTGLKDIVVETEVGKKVAFDKLPKAEAEYSDGSVNEYRVEWDKASYDKVDFNTPGTYEITGELQQTDYSEFVIDNFADPTVLYSEDTGKYYFIATTGSDGNVSLLIREADDINSLATAEMIPVKGQNGYSYELGVNKDTSKRLVWAPELHKIGDYWYCLFASEGTAWDRQCCYMMKNVDGELANPDSWEPAVKVKGIDGESDLYPQGITLDMTYFEAGGVHYLAWAQRETTARGGRGNGNSDIWIATIDPEDPTVITSEPVMMNQCEYGWEKRTTDVVEGPYTIKKDGKIYMTYSGSGVDQTYCIGYLWADTDADLTNPESWTKCQTPVLTTEMGQESGPGHSAFTIDEYGNQVFVYHFFRGSYSQRSARARILHWSATDVPVLNMTPEEELSSLTDENGKIDYAVKAKIVVEEVKAASVTLNQTAAALKKGQSVTLTATVTPANTTNKAVTWTTSNPSVATVANGVVTATGTGTAVITAACQTVSATCNVTVAPDTYPATAVTLSKTKATLNVGKKLTLTATVQPANSTDTVTWSSSNEKVATVVNGVVTAKKAGTAVITAKAGAVTKTCKITVNQKVKKLTLNKKKLTLKKGKKKTLKVTKKPTTANEKLYWKSSKPKVASVKNGKVTAKKKGNATITVYTKSGKKATCKVKVK